MTKAALRRRLDIATPSPQNKVSANWWNTGKAGHDAACRDCGFQPDDCQGVPARSDSSPERKIRGNRLRQHPRFSGVCRVVERCAFSTCTHRTGNCADEGSDGLMADGAVVATRTV